MVLAVSVNANPKVSLKSGSTAVFSKSANAFVIFNYNGAEIIGKDMSLEDFIEEKGLKYESKWEMAQTMSHKDFIKRFNKKSTGLQLSADSTANTKYKLVVSIKSIDMGNTAKSLIPIGARTDGGVALFGKITVSEISGKVLCVLNFSDIQGMGSVSIQARLLLAYQQLNSSLMKFIKKGDTAVTKSSRKIDNDDDDEEEYDRPKAQQKQKRRAVEEDDDDDDEEEYVRPKTQQKQKRRVVEEDEDDDDDDDEYDRPKPQRKHKKRVIEDDEDEDDDD